MAKENTRGELIASQIKAHPEMDEATIAAMIDTHITSARHDLLDTLERLAHTAESSALAILSAVEALAALADSDEERAQLITILRATERLRALALEKRRQA